MLSKLQLALTCTPVLRKCLSKNNTTLFFCVAWAWGVFSFYKHDNHDMTVGGTVGDNTRSGYKFDEAIMKAVLSQTNLQQNVSLNSSSSIRSNNTGTQDAIAL